MFKFLLATSNNYASRVLAGCLLKLKIMQETLLFFSFPFLFCSVRLVFILFENSPIYYMCSHKNSLKTLFNRESGFGVSHKDPPRTRNRVLILKYRFHHISFYFIPIRLLILSHSFDGRSPISRPWPALVSLPKTYTVNEKSGAHPSNRPKPTHKQPATGLQPVHVLKKLKVASCANDRDIPEYCLHPPHSA